MTLKKWDRYSLESLNLGDSQDKRGNIFLSEAGQVNLENMTILSTTVDTVRQLYLGSLNSIHLEEVINCYNEHKNYVSPEGDVFSVGGAMAGGYKYKLQNNSLGLVILLKHKFHESDSLASHLKIELSPVLIQSLDPLEIQQLLDRIANFWLVKPKPAGCAVHLAADVQGWQPESDFLSRFVCRSKRITSSSGISDFMVESGEIATVYSRGQSMLFGTASGLQCAIYNKTREALARDKLDFWAEIWGKLGGNEPFSSAYNPEIDVWRVEVRFHQSIIREYAAGTLDKSGRYDWLNKKTGELIGTNPALERFLDIVPHLSGLWKTATLSFRLDTKKGRLICPAWQKLNEDCLFFDTENFLTYRRVRKTPGQGSEKNICLALGNLITLYARQKFSVSYSLNCLVNSGIWEEVTAYYRARNIGLGELKQLIGQRLLERRLLGKAA